MDSINKKTLKAGTWYIICTFLSKGIVFLTTPVFTRVLDTQEYGITSTYNSWLSFFTVISTLDLYSCIQISRIDYEDKKEEFLSSILSLSSLSAIVVYLIFKIITKFFPEWMGIPVALIDFMFLEIIFRNAFTLLQTHHRTYLKYKLFVGLTMLTVCSSPLISLMLIKQMNNNKYWGRVVGNAIPMFFVGSIIFISIIKKGMKLYSPEYWSYGLKLSLPLIPHHLSSDILNHFDRIIINFFTGSTATAQYSVSSSYALIVQVVWHSFNNAWVPWFYDKMRKNTEHTIGEIKKYVRVYLHFFSYLALGIIAIAPEAIKIFASSEYWGCECAAVPIVIGVYFQFVYSLYANIEFFYKQTYKLMYGSVIAAVVNTILNVICIPRWGYIAAAYTTMFSYFILLCMHYFMSKKIEKRDLYDVKFIIITVSEFILCTVFLVCFFDMILIRYFLIFILGLYIVCKYKLFIRCFFL